jgi:hypothetical protein
MNKEQVEKIFRARLQALLDEFGADLEADDHWHGHPECGSDIRMTVTIPSVFDYERDIVLREFAEIDLGSHVNSTLTGKS